MQTSIYGITPDVVGHCDKFEEKQLGNERWNLFTGCPMAKTATIVLRGGSEQVVSSIGIPWIFSNVAMMMSG